MWTVKSGQTGAVVVQPVVPLLVPHSAVVHVCTAHWGSSGCPGHEGSASVCCEGALAGLQAAIDAGYAYLGHFHMGEIIPICKARYDAARPAIFSEEKTSHLARPESVERSSRTLARGKSRDDCMSNCATRK